mmetsp:Transcript_36922/g.69006  ORF Transcript_36922/g.69006 Transcript_36922/m.69006 type:complete len:853 (+) Transcript_36922:100-2658(+)
MAAVKPEENAMAIMPVEDTPDEGDIEEEVKEEGLGNDTKKLLLRFTKNKQTVDTQDVIDFLEEQQAERASFMRLPFTIFFFVIFCVSALIHENITDSSMVQREVRGMLEGTTYEGAAVTSGHKDMFDIDTKEDIYTYLREAIIPLFINPIGTPREDIHRVLRYNQIIGGMLLQQVRRREVNCADEYPNLGPFPADGLANPILTDFSCFPWYTESDDCFGPNSNQVVMGWCPDAKVWESQGVRRLDYVPEGGGAGGSSMGARTDPGPDQFYSIYLYEYEGHEMAQQKLNFLQEHGWIDDATSWVGIRMLLLNPDLGIYVHVTVNVYMTPAGAMLPKVTAQSFQLEPYQYMWVIALDVLFVLCVVWLTIGVFKTFYHAARKENFIIFMEDLWNWVDLFSVLFSIALIILWLACLDKFYGVKKAAMDVRTGEPQPLTQEQVSSMTAADRLDQLKAGGDESYLNYAKTVADLHLEMISVSEYLEYWRFALCWYTIFISLKFLESFAAQPRLAVVTETIRRATPDLIHYFIVLITIFLSYAVAGMYLFGRRLHSFHSLSTAINTCFLMMLGDFDWEELSAEHPTTAGLWFWTYMILMAQLMLNIFMAIIMDVYTEVKSDAADFAPIWTQMWTITVQSYNAMLGKMVSNTKLLEVLNEISSTTKELDESVLMKWVGPGLSREQAEGLIESTRENVDNKLNKGVTMSEAMRMIGWVKIAVQKIGMKVEELVGEERVERDIIARGAEDATQNALESDDAPAEDLGPATAYVAEAEVRLEQIEGRMGKIEDFMQESLQYTSFRGKDLRNRLAVIEDLIRSQRDALVRDQRDVWDQMPPQIGFGSRVSSRANSRQPEMVSRI